jgi:hypothetical protein
MKKYEVTQEILDKKENYMGTEDDEWPYSNDFDFVCRYDITPLIPESAGGVGNE